MSQRHGFAAVTRLGRWVFLCLVGATLSIGPLAIAGPQTNVRWPPQEVLSSTADLSNAAAQHDDKQDDDNGARVREGKRVRRGQLPSTDAAFPLWLSPLIVASGLGLITLGGVLLVMLRNAEDESYLRTTARVGEKSVSGVPSGSDAALHGLELAPRTETNLNMIEGQLSRHGKKRTSSDRRSVAKAWRALGRGSTQRRTR